MATTYISFRYKHVSQQPTWHRQMPQRQLVAALKAATAAGAKIKAAEAWMENPGPDESRWTKSTGNL